jgi:hypothetical protein
LDQTEEFALKAIRKFFDGIREEIKRPITITEQLQRDKDAIITGQGKESLDSFFQLFYQYKTQFPC